MEIRYSFIIPHKNTPALLQRCIDSIPQREDVEIIIIDNNSDSALVDFNNFPGYKRKDVLILFDKESKGAGGARNMGIKASRGKWVLFIDADDYYTDGFLNYIDCYSDQDAVYFAFNLIKNDKKISLPYSQRFLKRQFEYSGCASDELKYRLSVPWNKMVKRDFLIHYAIQFEDCIAGNDIFYTYQVGYFAKNTAVINKRLYNYVSRRDSITHKRKNPAEFYICSLMHHYQRKEFLKFVGHEKWSRGLPRFFVTVLVKKGIVEFIKSINVLIRNYKDIKKAQNLFVDKINLVPLSD